MTDMIKNVAHDLGGIGVYGIVSILIFFLFFTGMVVWALCARKSYVEKMQVLPLEDGSVNSKRDASGRSTPRPGSLAFGRGEGESQPVVDLNDGAGSQQTFEVSHE